MKNQRNFLQTMKPYGRRVVTTTLLVGTLVLPWNAAEAEPSVFADFNGNGYMAFAIGIPPRNVHGLSHSTSLGITTAAGASQIIHDMSRYGLQTHAYTPTFLHHHAPDSLNGYEPEFAVNDDGFLVVFSW